MTLAGTAGRVAGAEPGVEPACEAAALALHGRLHEAVGQPAQDQQYGQEHPDHQELLRERVRSLGDREPPEHLDHQRVQQVDREADQPEPGEHGRHLLVAAGQADGRGRRSQGDGGGRHEMER